MATISPLAPKGFPKMPAIAGVKLASGPCGIRYRNRFDLMLAEFAPGTQAAGVFTRSKTRSAAVDWCRMALKKGKARALVVNSGNSNAFTGIVGEEAVVETAQTAAALAGVKKNDVFLASTGVIGQRLPVEKLVAALPGLHKNAQTKGGKSWLDAASAIMTTDTFPKGATRQAKIGKATVTINGFAKGSGMIAPDMATMLAYVFTDAKIPQKVLQSMLKRGADRSFNAITVDSDTSTSDSLMLFATGKGERHAKIDSASDPVLKEFKQALDDVLLDLAHQIVRDGEGATKFVTVEVGGAQSARAAQVIGKAIANSPLVKTAIAGEDANWGRIVMAVGKSGEAADRDRLSVAVGGVVIAKDGLPVVGYDETPVAQHMKGEEILIQVDVGVGRGRARVWTCDLTHGYIDINADYRS